MQENFRNKPELEFNAEFDKGLIQTPHARIITSHLLEMYPFFYQMLSESNLVEEYVEPLIKEQLELESNYREEGYPEVGVQEKAFNDVMASLVHKLRPFEDKETLNGYDLDTRSYIDTEEI